MSISYNFFFNIYCTDFYMNRIFNNTIFNNSCGVNILNTKLYLK